VEASGGSVIVRSQGGATGDEFSLKTVHIRPVVFSQLLAQRQ